MMNMEHVKVYMAHISKEYNKFVDLAESRSETERNVRQKMVDNFIVELEKGSKYLKIVLNHADTQQRSVHSFICIKDNDKFKEGDILKAAGWAAPAKNFARGNVITGNYENISWTGA